MLHVSIVNICHRGSNPLELDQVLEGLKGARRPGFRRVKVSTLSPSEAPAPHVVRVWPAFFALLSRKVTTVSVPVFMLLIQTSLFESVNPLIRSPNLQIQCVW